MITYGLYFMTAEGKFGWIYAVTVSWVTQVSFNPTVVAVLTKADSHTDGITKTAGNFALNVLGKGQLGAAYAFLKRLSRTLTQAKLRTSRSLIHMVMFAHVIIF